MCETGRLVLYPGELAYMLLGHNLSTLTLSHWVTLWVALTFIQHYEPIIGHPLMGGPRPEQIQLCMGTYRGISRVIYP